MSPLTYYILFCGIWAAGNGLLHDIAVLNQKRKWDRELIRLMMDGHMLLFSGVIYLLCFKAVDAGSTLAMWVCVADAIFIVGYCLLIFKILPSYATMVINIVACVWLLLEVL